MKIFVTVGFESYPFDRLLKAIDEGVERGAIAGEVSIQDGHSGYRVLCGRSYPFLEFEEVAARLDDADIVVGHAGVGTMLLCLAHGKIPILMPRESRYHEHVDNHQVEFARRMESEGTAIVAWDKEDLLSKINRYHELAADCQRRRADREAGTLASCLETILAERVAEEKVRK
jgi:UDP-N-acetylglucosamine transferase subunit ALG13